MVQDLILHGNRLQSSYHIIKICPHTTESPNEETEARYNDTEEQMKNKWKTNEMNTTGINCICYIWRNTGTETDTYDQSERNDKRERML